MLEKALADRVYVFCPELDKGIMFYDQSPKDNVAELTGSLPDGVFWSSLEKTVQWDENFNGRRLKNIEVSSEEPLLVNSIQVNTKNNISFHVATIMVSKQILLDLLLQIDEPTFTEESKGHYKILNFHSKIKNDLFSNKSNIEENNLHIN